MLSTDLLIDGYNLLFAAGLGQSDYAFGELQRARQRLVTHLLELLRPEEITQTAVVFDSKRPPPDLPSLWCIHGLRVIYAQPYGDADEMLEELIAQHLTPKRLTVVSSDHRLHHAAQRSRATAIDSEDFWDHIRYRQVNSLKSGPYTTSRSPKSSTATETSKSTSRSNLTAKLLKGDHRGVQDATADELQYWLERFADVSVSELSRNIQPFAKRAAVEWEARTATSRAAIPTTELKETANISSESSSSPGEKKQSLRKRRSPGAISNDPKPVIGPDLFSPAWIAEMQRWVDAQQ